MKSLIIKANRLLLVHSKEFVIDKLVAEAKGSRTTRNDIVKIVKTLTEP